MARKKRAIHWIMLCAVLMPALLLSGCARFRVPRIDPSGQSIFVWDDAPGFTYSQPAPVAVPTASPPPPNPFDPGMGYAVPAPADACHPGWTHVTRGGLLDGSLISRLRECCRCKWDELPYTPCPGECGPPIQYGWEPHPLLMQPPAAIAAPVVPVRPRQFVAPPQPLLPYGYGYDTGFPAGDPDAVTSTGGDPLRGQNGRLVINPGRLVAPVGQTVVLLGSICGADGYYIKDQPIEWSVSPDSVGTIVEVDRADQSLLDRWRKKAPIKQSGTYAVGRTSMGSQVLPRDITNPSDDVYLASGQTWVSISSASEGSTHVTAVAPSVLGWQERQQNATIHWVDGRWQFPTPAISNYGGAHTLATRVARATDGAPVEGWLVRYEIVGGTPAAFDANGAQVMEVPTNSQGEAPVTVIRQGDFSGTTQINMQVIRRGRTPGDLPRLPVGQGATTITWTGSGTPAPPDIVNPPQPAPPSNAPLLTTRVDGASIAEVGTTARYQFRVENIGSAAAENVTITSRVPASLQYASSAPQAGEFGDTLRWEVGSIGPGMVKAVTVTYRVVGDGAIDLCATASAPLAEDATDCARTTVQSTRARVELRIDGDQTGRVGDQVHYDLFVNNQSDAPLRNVRMEVEFDDGLQHPADRNGEQYIFRDFSEISPRGLLTQPLNFNVRSAGRRCFTVTISGDGGVREVIERCVDIAPEASTPVRPPATNPSFASPTIPPLQAPPTNPNFGSPPTGAAPTGPTDLDLRVRRMAPDRNNPNYLIYKVEIQNTGVTNHRNVALSIQTPTGTRFQTSIDPPGVLKGRRSADGRQLDYEPINELRHGEAMQFQITVTREADQVGNFLARVMSDQLPSPIQADDRSL